MTTKELNVDVQQPDTAESDAKAVTALDRANALVITTPEDYKQADAFCKGLFSLRKEIEADFADSLEAADKAKKAATEAKSALVEQIDSHVKPVQEAERIIKGKLFAWAKLAEEARRIEQDKARADALRKAEDERIAKAIALENQGKTAAAAAEIAKPIKVAPIVAPPAPVERESKIASYWSYEVVAPSEVKREFCKPDAGSIQASMNAYKKQGKSIEEIQERIGGIVITERVK